MLRRAIGILGYAFERLGAAMRARADRGPVRGVGTVFEGPHFDRFVGGTTTVEPVPVVELSEKARQMVMTRETIPAPREQDRVELPLAGSLADRVRRARMEHN